MLRITLHGNQLVLVSAHAPHWGKSSADIKQWWEQLDDHIGQYVGQSPMIRGIDANAHYSDSVHGYIGTADLERRQNLPANYMMHCLVKWGMWLPSTYPSVQSGPHGTWYNPHLDSWHRCDYFVLSGGFLDEHIQTWVDGNLDVGGSSFDHIPVALQVTDHWQCKGGGKPVNDRHVNLLALKSATPQQVELALLRSMNMPWNLDVHEHGAQCYRFRKTYLMEKSISRLHHQGNLGSAWSQTYIEEKTLPTKATGTTH